jgi:hypothetical protein
MINMMNKMTNVLSLTVLFLDEVRDPLRFRHRQAVMHLGQIHARPLLVVVASVHRRTVLAAALNEVMRVLGMEDVTTDEADGEVHGGQHIEDFEKVNSLQFSKSC